MRLEQLEARDVPAIFQAGLPNWEAAGPSPQINSQVIVAPGPLINPSTGAVEEVSAHPTDPNILFVAGVNGGVWRTFNAQDPVPNYTPLTDQLPSLSIGSMDLNPNNPNQLVAGVARRGSAVDADGDLNAGGDLVGVIYSENALAPNPAFRVLGGPLANKDILAVTVRDGYILAGGRGGLFRSVDNGATFTELTGTGGLPNNPINFLGQTFAPSFYSLQPDPADANRVYALSDLGLFRTDNIRAAVPTWTDVSSPLMDFNTLKVNGKISIHNSPGNNVVYVATVAATTTDPSRAFGQLDTVTFSTDRGATWTEMDLATGVTDPVPVIDASNASPIQITSPNHPFQTGNRVVVSGVQGNEGANAIWTVTRTGQDTFTLDGSVGTGIYTGGGQVEAIFGPNNGNQGGLHMSFVADPADPNIVYVGGDSNPNSFTGSGNLLRGDRSIAPGGGSFFPGPQFQPLVNENAQGTAPHADSRVLAFNAAGTLYEGDDGGLYRRFAPRVNGDTWQSAMGNLSLGQFYSLNYDIQNNVLFGGTQDSGSIAQVDGAGSAGNPVWDNVLFGDGGDSTVDNTSTPGQTTRFVTNNALQGARRIVVDSTNTVLRSEVILFRAPGDPAYLSGLDDADKNQGLTVFSAKIVTNSVDARLLMLGNAKLYEDANPAGPAGDTIAKVTPTGTKGLITSIVYGGRQSGINIVRIAYVGTEGGQLFLRGPADGFRELTVPGTGQVRQVVTDPDDFRRVYVLRGNEIFFSTNAGAAWTNITQNLVAPGIDAAGNPIGFQRDPLTGAVTGGLTTLVNTIAVYDPTPNGNGPSNLVLFAGGRSGVFRFVPGLLDPNLFPNAGWTEYGAGLPNVYVDNIKVFGNRLIAGTQGRGAWQIPDVGPTAFVAATVTIAGDAGDNLMQIVADPSNPNSVVVTDGLGNSLRVDRSNSPSFRFVGGAGADTIVIAASGQPGGDLAFIKSPIFVDAGNDLGDRLFVVNAARTTAATVTVTGDRVGGGPADNLFSSVPGAGVTYTGLANGELTVDLGTSTVGGNRINVQSTTAARTRLLGTRGSDEFVVNGLAGVTDDGDLGGINGIVSIDARNPGADELVVSDFGARTGNFNAVIGGNTVTGLAGPTDGAVVEYFNIGRLVVRGSNAAGLSESFRVETPATVLVLDALDGPDAVNIRNTANPVTVFGGAGFDTIRVSSQAGDNDDGDLTGIRGPVFVDAGTGDNRLVVSNFGNPFGATFTVTANALSGATLAPIIYSATGGRFVAADGTGILLRGSNAASDRFVLAGTLAFSQTAVDGDGGADVYAVAGDSLNGDVRLRGGAGGDTFTVDPGLFGVTSDALLLEGGGGGRDLATLLGFEDDDLAPVVDTLTSAAGGRVTGIGMPIDYATLTNLNYDGRTGRNNFTFVDGTNRSYGSVNDPAAGIVYRPLSVDAGEIRIAGGSVGPVVAAFGINGSDVGGLVVNGDPTGTGAFKDTLTVLGVSDNGRASSLGELTAPSGGDDFIISDQSVFLSNQSLGSLRAVGLGQSGDGQPTIANLVVRTGDESGRGDTVSITPSQTVNIVVDAGGPTRGRNGDKLQISTSEPRSVRPLEDFTGGPARSQVVTESGATFSFSGFENAGATRQIFAVGADAGGGPRVRVYDAVTQEVLFDRFVYATTFTGGVRVATGDVTGDGVPDLVVAAGYGGGPHIQIFDGVTFEQVANFFAYESTFRGGAFVAIGDLDGDGVGEVITGAGLGGGPLVKVFDGTGRLEKGFFAYDSNFRGGVRVAAGDVNGDGFADIVTGAGPGGGPHVRVFNAATLEVLNQFLVFDDNYHGGVYVAAGDVDGDGFADIVAGPGANDLNEIRVRSSSDGGSVVRIGVFDVARASAPTPVPTEDLAQSGRAIAGLAAVEAGGIRVAVSATDPNGDGLAQILSSRGPGFLPRVRAYTLAGATETNNFLAFEETFDGGVFVG